MLSALDDTLAIAKTHSPQVWVDEMTGRKFVDVDDYLRSIPDHARVVLEKIREVVKRGIPDATESIGYNIPAFGMPKRFFYYAAFKNHVGVYPPVVDADEVLNNQLSPYRGEKGNLKFPLSEPMPYELILKVARHLSQQYA